MKIIEFIRQPHGTGITLFILAASTCIGLIIASLTGYTAWSNVLVSITQPLCAAAIGVLIYLGIVSHKNEVLDTSPVHTDEQL